MGCRRIVVLAAVAVVGWWSRAAPAQNADARVEWLKANAVPVRTIDPKDDDFEDLAPLIASIGNARIVMLGEQTHGDGACFLAKSRLIKFLHQKMGFDVLAFESGMFDLRWCEEAMRTGEPVEELHRRGLFGIWALSAQCRVLLEYVKGSRATARPLELAGFDSQFSSGHARDKFVPDLIRFCDRADPNLLPQESRIALGELAAWLQERESGAGKGGAPKALGVAGTVVETMERDAATLERAHAPRDVVFMRRSAANMLAFVRQTAAQGEKDFEAGGRIRDTAMGENLAWLADDYYAGRKVIVWAASMHTMRNAPQAALVDSPISYKNTVTMGHVAWEKLKGGKEGAIYSIMFTAFKGKAGMPWNNPWAVPAAPKGSIDELMHRTGLPFAFLDMKNPGPGGEWLRERLVARPLGYAPCEAVWPDQFDAVFHTDEMVPSMRQ